MKHLFLLLFTTSIFAQVTLFRKQDKDALNMLTSASNTTQIFQSSNNVGISTPAPLNKLHITGGNANTGGIRLPITSTSGAQIGQPIGVDANGDIVRLANATFDATVNFDINVNPNTAGTTFTPNTPANTNVLYVSNIDGSQWTYNGTTYLSEPVSNDWKTGGNSATVQATNFIGTTDNRGLSFRTNNLIRQTITNAGNVGIGVVAPTEKLHVDGTGNVNMMLSSATGGPTFNLYKARTWAGMPAATYVGFGGTDDGASSIRGSIYVPNTANTGVFEAVSFLKATGNVGIGTILAPQKLTVNGTIFSSAGSAISAQGAHLMWNKGNADGATWLINNKGGGPGGIIFGTSTNANVVTEHARFLDNGNLGIGTNAPTQKLHVIGNILATGTITPSDKRLKRNIKKINYTINDLLKLVPVSYTKKFSLDTNEKGEVNEIGFIAQDLRNAIPELVIEGTDKDKILAVNYTSLIPILVKCMQDQQKEIEILKSKIK